MDHSVKCFRYAVQYSQGGKAEQISANFNRGIKLCVAPYSVYKIFKMIKVKVAIGAYGIIRISSYFTSFSNLFFASKILKGKEVNMEESTNISIISQERFFITWQNSSRNQHHIPYHLFLRDAHLLFPDRMLYEHHLLQHQN